MKRLVGIFIGLSVMLGTIVAVQAGAYVVGGLAEEHLFAGASRLTNILFLRMQSSLIEGLQQQGFDFYHGGRWQAEMARLVTSFRTTPALVDAFVAAARKIQAR